MRSASSLTRLVVLALVGLVVMLAAAVEGNAAERQPAGVADPIGSDPAPDRPPGPPPPAPAPAPTPPPAPPPPPPPAPAPAPAPEPAPAKPKKKKKKNAKATNQAAQAENDESTTGEDAGSGGTGTSTSGEPPVDSAGTGAEPSEEAATGSGAEEEPSGAVVTTSSGSDSTSGTEEGASAASPPTPPAQATPAPASPAPAPATQPVAAEGGLAAGSALEPDETESTQIAAVELTSASSDRDVSRYVVLLALLAGLVLLAVAAVPLRILPANGFRDTLLERRPMLAVAGAASLLGGLMVAVLSGGVT